MDVFYAALLALAVLPVLLIVLAIIRALAGHGPRWHRWDNSLPEIGSPGGGAAPHSGDIGGRGLGPNRGRPGVREPRRPLRPAGSEGAALELPTEDQAVTDDGPPWERPLLPSPTLPPLAS